MSTDFSIEPVSGPAAANEAVTTELPPGRSAAAAEASSPAGITADSIGPSVSHQVIIDREPNALVYQVVDNRTTQVVRQFPDEAELRRRAYFRALDLSKQAPTRLGATDRTI
jgi:hypothetical protein